jgi:hypothetical protein
MCAPPELRISRRTLSTLPPPRKALSCFLNACAPNGWADFPGLWPIGLSGKARPGPSIFGWTLVIRRVQVKDYAYPRVPNQN